MVGFSKNTLYARIRAGTFPRPIALGPQTTAFLESEIIDWMKIQVEKSDRSVSFRQMRAQKAAEPRRNSTAAP
jgi:prophage regulatory protein